MSENKENKKLTKEERTAARQQKVKPEKIQNK